MKGNIYIFKENEYITTGDFAKILNMNDSTVRYYCDEFEDFIKIIKVKKRRFFKAEHVEKFIYLKYLLKDKRLPVKLAKEFLATEDGKNMKIIEKGMENHLLTTMVQFNETLERFIKDEAFPAKDVYNFHNTEEVNVQKPKVQRRESPKNDVETIKKQIDFHIHNLKNSVEKYETAKRYELLDDMIRALSDLDIYLGKIKILNSNLLELQNP